jgi:hypothetical protein
VPPINVLVVFYSRYGETERLALAAGLGAIQAEGNIRLRRVPDLAQSDRIEADAEWARSLARMNRDYVTPRAADPPWADVIILAAPPGSSAEIVSFVQSLPSMAPMHEKLAAPLAAPDDAPCLAALFAAAARAGLISVPMQAAAGDRLTRARLHGQRLVHLGRALKNAAPGASTYASMRRSAWSAAAPAAGRPAGAAISRSAPCFSRSS